MQFYERVKELQDVQYERYDATCIVSMSIFLVLLIVDAAGWLGSSTITRTFS